MPLGRLRRFPAPIDAPLSAGRFPFSPHAPLDVRHLVRGLRRSTPCRNVSKNMTGGRPSPQGSLPQVKPILTLAPAPAPASAIAQRWQSTLLSLRTCSGPPGSPPSAVCLFRQQPPLSSSPPPDPAPLMSFLHSASCALNISRGRRGDVMGRPRTFHVAAFRLC